MVNIFLLKNQTDKSEDFTNKHSEKNSDKLQEINFLVEKCQIELISHPKNSLGRNIENNKQGNISVDQENLEDEIKNYKIQIDTLRQIVIEKDNEMLKILKENELYKTEFDKLLKNNPSNLNNLNPQELNNEQITNNNTIISKNSEDLRDESNLLVSKEKFIKIKNSLENYKNDNSSLLQQVLYFFYLLVKFFEN